MLNTIEKELQPETTNLINTLLKKKKVTEHNPLCDALYIRSKKSKNK